MESTAKVQEHSVRQYYDLILSGQMKNNRDRIMKFCLTYKGTITRHVIEHAFRPHNNEKAWFDNKKVIRWQTLGRPVQVLVDSGYLIESKGRIADPITGNPAKTLTPDAEAYGQRRMF